MFVTKWKCRNCSASKSGTAKPAPGICPGSKLDKNGRHGPHQWVKTVEGHGTDQYKKW